MRTLQIETADRKAQAHRESRERAERIAAMRKAAGPAGEAFEMSDELLADAEADALGVEVIAAAALLGQRTMQDLRVRVRAALGAAQCEAELSLLMAEAKSAALAELARSRRADSDAKLLGALREHVGRASRAAGWGERFDWSSATWSRAALAAPAMIERALRLARLAAADVDAIEMEVAGPMLAILAALGSPSAIGMRQAVREALADLSGAATFAEIDATLHELAELVEETVATERARFKPGPALRGWIIRGQQMAAEGRGFDWRTMSWLPVAAIAPVPAEIAAALANLRALALAAARRAA